MDYKLNNIEIVSMSCAVPKKTIDNTGVAGFERLRKIVGVEKRHTLVDSGMNIADLAVVAAKDAIEKSGIDKEKIRVVCYVTQDPVFANPGTGMYFQKELGLDSNCIVFDVNYGCSGFVAGLQICSSVLLTVAEDDVFALMINAEYPTSRPHKIKNDELIFGDATSCTIMKKGNTEDKIVGMYGTDGNRYKAIFSETLTAPAEMDGDSVFMFSTVECVQYLKDFMKENNITETDFDFFVPHQAGKLIVETLVKKMGFPKEKVLFSLKDYGNTAGASIPVSICHNRNCLKDESKILAFGFGVGLAWGGVLFSLKKSAVNEIVLV